MMESNPATPALVLGGYLTALGTLRCLAAAGIPRYCLTHPESYVRASRYHSPAPRGMQAVRTPAELPSYLESLPLERAVLIPCSDEWALACAALGSSVRERFSYAGPELEELQTILDKAQLEARLQELGIHRPRTRPAESEEDLDWLASDPDSIWFLKPADSPAFRRRFGRKAIRVQSLAEATKILDACREYGLSMLLQEYIPGPADRHYFVDGFVDRHGEILTILARRRIRMHPSDFGDSSYLRGVGLEEAEGAVDSCKKLLGHGAFRGIFSAEFKRDPRDEQFRLIEVNARPWAYVGFAESCGFNAPSMAYRDALGMDQPTVTIQSEGARFQILPNDFKAALAATRSGDLGWLNWLAQGWGAESVLLRRDDPLPAIRQFGETVRSSLARAFHPGES